MNEEEIGKQFEEEFKKLNVEIDKANVLIVGNTGVGKSSLINHIFGEELAEVGVGRPVTQGVDVFEKDGFGVFIYKNRFFFVSKYNTHTTFVNNRKIT